jgi:hypothetical protein
MRPEGDALGDYPAAKTSGVDPTDEQAVINACVAQLHRSIDARDWGAAGKWSGALTRIYATKKARRVGALTGAQA